MTDFTPDVVVNEVMILSKFEGEPLPENEIERMHIHNGEVVRIDKIENGEIISTEQVKEV